MSTATRMPTDHILPPVARDLVKVRRKSRADPPPANQYKPPGCEIYDKSGHCPFHGYLHTGPAPKEATWPDWLVGRWKIALLGSRAEPWESGQGRMTDYSQRFLAEQELRADGGMGVLRRLNRNGVGYMDDRIYRPELQPIAWYYYDGYIWYSRSRLDTGSPGGGNSYESFFRIQEFMPEKDAMALY